MIINFKAIGDAKNRRGRRIGLEEEVCAHWKHCHNDGLTGKRTATCELLRLIESLDQKVYKTTIKSQPPQVFWRAARKERFCCQSWTKHLQFANYSWEFRWEWIIGSDETKTAAPSNKPKVSLESRKKRTRCHRFWWIFDVVGCFFFFLTKALEYMTLWTLWTTIGCYE